jgi:hypothetical protein
MVTSCPSSLSRAPSRGKATAPADVSMAPCSTSRDQHDLGTPICSRSSRANQDTPGLKGIYPRSRTPTVYSMDTLVHLPSLSTNQTACCTLELRRVPTSSACGFRCYVLHRARRFIPCTLPPPFYSITFVHASLSSRAPRCDAPPVRPFKDHSKP